MNKSFYHFISILILSIFTIIFALFSITAPNYYETEKGSFGILMGSNGGTACLGMCPLNDTRDCELGHICKANIAFPVTVALITLGICFYILYNKSSKTINFNVISLSLFITVILSIASIILQTQTRLDHDDKTVSMKIKDVNVYGMGFSFSVLTIIFSTIALICSIMIMHS
jgi:hypothetical protein